MRKVLFVGAHTDDESICAGTLIKLKKLGADIHVITFSKSATPNGGNITEEYLSAINLLGATHELFDFGDDMIPDHRNEIRQILFDYVTQDQYDAAFILSPYDDHQSHACVGEEAQRVMKNRVPVILRCHYPWNYKANVNLFVELTEDELKKKLDLMNMYKSQIFRYNYVKMYDFYTRADGLSVKHGPCEKFEVVRMILKNEEDCEIQREGCASGWCLWRYRPKTLL